MSDDELKQIMYALTVNAASCPAAVGRVTTACGAIPQRGPDLMTQLAQCGGPDALLALWRELIDNDPNIVSYADEQWAKYVAATTMPGPLTQAVNAASAAVQETTAIMKQTPPVSAEEAERRFNICLGCEFLSQDDLRCSQCGCFMRFKTAFRTATCPVGKWSQAN